MTFYPKVREGLWRNELTGSLVLTLNERAAGILSAFVVLFVGLVATNAWIIVKFALHQSRVSTTNRDAYHHQLQAVLRNVNSHAQVSWITIMLSARWSVRIGFTKAVKLGSPVVLVALLSFLGWSATQLFVSLIWSSPGNQFLIKNAFCGTFIPYIERLWLVQAQRMNAAAAYVAQCPYERYNAPECGMLPIPAVNWTIEDAPCPFPNSEFCLIANSTPMRIQTEFINSNTHLGVNEKSKDSVEYRKAATCSPVLTVGTIEDNGVTIHLKYGESVHNAFIQFYLELHCHHTSSHIWIRPVQSTLPYDPVSETWQWRPNSTIFGRKDAEASIFFLVTNNVLSHDPIYDPLFANEHIGKSSNGEDVYIPNTSVTVLICVEEHVLCNPNKDRPGRCANFTQATPAIELFDSLGLSETQRITAARIILFLVPTGLSEIVSRTSPQLLASMAVSLRQQFQPLPVDQWRREVARWFSIGLHLLQNDFIEYVSGPAEATRDLAHEKYETLGDLDFCKKQRIGNVAGFQNFNAMALFAVLILGAIIISAGFSIEILVGAAQKILRKGEQHRLQWILDGIFQQQRLAYEAAGVQPWDKLDEFVPMTDETNFPCVNTRDAKRPQLHQASTVCNEFPVGTPSYQGGELK